MDSTFFFSSMPLVNSASAVAAMASPLCAGSSVLVFSEWQCDGGGLSRAGLPAKNPHGRSLKPIGCTGITGQSSGPDHVVGAERVPEHHVGIDQRTVRRQISGQAAAAGRLVRVVAGGEHLVAVVRGHPQLAGDEARAPGHRGAGMTERGDRCSGTSL